MNIGCCKVGRRRGLCVLLAALVVILAACWVPLRLSYSLHAAQRSIREHDFDRALQRLGACREQGLRSPRWHYLFACATRRKGEVAGVEKSLQRALQLGWDAGDVDRQQLLLKAQAGQIKTVEADLVELLGADLNDEAAEEIYEAMARGYLSGLHLGDATRCLQSWAVWQVDNEIPPLWMGDFQFMLDRPKEAEIEYRRALAIKPDYLEARLKLGRALIQQGELAEALGVLEPCLEQASADSSLLLSLAEIKRRQGDAGQAQELLRSALVLDLPVDQEAYALAELGQMALEDRKFAQARSLLNESIDRNPNLISSRQALAAVLSSLGRDDQAESQRSFLSKLRDEKRALNQALHDAMDDPGNAAHRRAAGLSYLDHGRLPQAVEWLTIALRIDPQDRLAHEGLARCYRMLGDEERSNAHLRAAERLPQNSP